MSRFHKEFFGEKSIEHDELVLKCLTEAGYKKILNIVEDIVCERYYPSLYKYLETPETIWICECADQVFCQRTNRQGWKDNKKYCQKNYPGATNSPGRCKYLTEPQKNEHDRYPTIKAPGQVYTGRLISSEKQEVGVTNYETEVICKNGNFIIGYADILLQITITNQLDLTITQDWIWDKYDSFTMTWGIIIEAKPVLKGFGAVLRQIKTYLETIGQQEPERYLGVIATYSDVSEQTREVLAKEKVFVAQFSKDED